MQKPADTQMIQEKFATFADESNFHVCGNGWLSLNELVDSPGAVYGTFAAWVCALAATFGEASFSDAAGRPTDRLDDLGWQLDALAAELLGISEAEFDRLFGNQPLGIVRERLARLARVAA